MLNDSINNDYQALFEQTSDIILVTDLNATILDINSAGCDFLGYTREEIISKNLSEFVDPKQLKNDPLALSEIKEGQHIIRKRRIIKNRSEIVEVESNTKKISDQKILVVARDLSKIQNLEKYVSISDSTLHAAFENSALGMILVSPRGKILKTNRAFCEMLGYSEKELLGLYFKDITHPDDLPEGFNFLKNANNNTTEKTTLTAEKRYICKNKSIIWVSINSSSVRDAKGTLLFFVTQIENITEKKKTREQLIEQEKQLRLFIEHSPAAIAMLDKDMKYILTSRRWIKDYGLENIQVIGKSHYEIFTTIPQRWKDIHQRCLAGATEKSEEDSFIREDGTTEWLRWEIHPWQKASGEIGGIIMLTEVITEKKKAEKKLQLSESRYRYLFDNSPVNIIIWDLKSLKILEVNDKVATTYGYTKEEFINLSVFDYRPKEDYEKIKDFAKHMLTDPLPKERKVWRHFKKDGTLMYMDIVSHKIYYKDRKAILSLGIDVTEQFKAEEQLKKSYENVRLLNKHLQTIREEERGEVAREIHDELGQQLTGLKMQLSFCAKKIQKLDESLQKDFTEINSLVDLTIISLRRIATDLRPSILDDLGLIPALEWQSVEFQKRSRIPCDFTMKSNDVAIEKNLSTAIFRIYQESLTNIMRYANATKVTSHLEINSNQILLTIHDDGKGFETEKISNNKTLGIFGMKERAQAFGGNLIINSTPSKGTTVSLILPVNQ